MPILGADTFLQTLLQQLPMVAVLLWLLREVLLRFDKLLGLLDGLSVAFSQLSSELQLYQQKNTLEDEARKALLELATNLASRRDPQEVSEGKR